MTETKHVPLAPAERNRLKAALDANVSDDFAILTGRDTSFAGSAEEIPDDEVIMAIRSVPVHY